MDRGEEERKRRAGEEEEVETKNSTESPAFLKTGFCEVTFAPSKRFEVSWNNRFTMYSFLSPSLQRAAAKGGAQTACFVHLDTNVSPLRLIETPTSEKTFCHFDSIISTVMNTNAL